ncbi:hypothetical protein [Candidatus Arsenophonus triatominarum]|nr:hypothetical protein [Candidatus Arsenophonus triatominarum]
MSYTIDFRRKVISVKESRRFNNSRNCETIPYWKSVFSTLA